MSANHRYTISLIVVVVLTVLGFGSWHFLARDDGPPSGVAQQQPTPAPALTEPARESAAPAPTADSAIVEEAEPVELAFDIVRVEPTGDAVIAGRGAPGARIELLRNGETHDSLVVDATGAFAFVPPPLPTGTSDVSLRATLPNGDVFTSRQSVTVVVDESLAQQPMVALVAPGEPTVVLSRPDAPGPVAAAPRPEAGDTTVEDIAEGIIEEIFDVIAEEAMEAPAEVAVEAPAPAQVGPVETETAEREAESVETAEVAATEGRTLQAEDTAIAEADPVTIRETPVAEAETAWPVVDVAEAEVSEVEVSEVEAAEAEVAEAEVAQVRTPEVVATEA
ncbi:MAG: hypothetical protein EA385_16920, partial [Salinarimonadaceae bacterium]